MHPHWFLVSLVLVGVMTMSAALVPVRAQGHRRVFQITMVSYKFTPDLIQVNQGDTVVLQLSNEDLERRTHSIAARLFIRIPVTARGSFRTGIDDERRFFSAEPGRRFEIEFVAQERGSFGFVCEIFDHGARGQVGAINVLPAGP